MKNRTIDIMIDAWRTVKDYGDYLVSMRDLNYGVWAQYVNTQSYVARFADNFSSYRIITPWSWFNDDFVSYWVFLDLFFVFLIIILIIMRIYSGSNKIEWFGNMIKVVIIGLFFEIIFLSYGMGYARKFIFWNNHFIYSPFVFYVKIFICIIAICVFISMLDYFKYEKFISYEMPIIMLLCIEGMFLMISSNDLFVMYIALELQSLSLYILASLKRYSNISVEAGLKYFIYGSFASGMLLFGISLIYGSVGVTDFTNLYMLMQVSLFDGGSMPVTMAYGFLLIVAGIFFKLGIAPFHFWIGDIYEGSPTIITYFFAVLPKISVLFIFYRAFFFCLNPQIAIINYSYIFLFLFVCCALASLL